MKQMKGVRVKLLEIVVAIRVYAADKSEEAVKKSSAIDHTFIKLEINEGPRKI